MHGKLEKLIFGFAGSKFYASLEFLLEEFLLKHSSFKLYCTNLLIL
jgi:hypothetical protein